jgi:hypothetical protein
MVHCLKQCLLPSNVRVSNGLFDIVVGVTCCQELSQLINEFGPYMPYNSTAKKNMPKLVKIVGHNGPCNVPSIIGVLSFWLLRSISYRFGVEREWFEEVEEFCGLFVKELPNDVLFQQLNNSLDDLVPRFHLQSTTEKVPNDAPSYSLRELVCLLLLPKDDACKSILKNFDNSLDIMTKMKFKDGKTLTGWLVTVGNMTAARPAVFVPTQSLNVIKVPKRSRETLDNKKTAAEKADKIATLFGIPTTQVFVELLTELFPDGYDADATKKKANKPKTKPPATPAQPSPPADPSNPSSDSSSGDDEDEEKKKTKTTGKPDSSEIMPPALPTEKRASVPDVIFTDKAAPKEGPGDTVEHIYKTELQIPFPEMDMKLIPFPSQRGNEELQQFYPTTKVAKMVEVAATDCFAAFLQIRFFELANYYINKRAKLEEGTLAGIVAGNAQRDEVDEVTADEIKMAVSHTPGQWQHLPQFEQNYAEIISKYKDGRNFSLEDFYNSIATYMEQIDSAELFRVSPIWHRTEYTGVAKSQVPPFFVSEKFHSYFCDVDNDELEKGQDGTRSDEQDSTNEHQPSIPDTPLARTAGTRKSSVTETPPAAMVPERKSPRLQQKQSRTPSSLRAFLAPLSPAEEKKRKLAPQAAATGDTTKTIPSFHSPVEKKKKRRHSVDSTRTETGSSGAKKKAKRSATKNN